MMPAKKLYRSLCYSIGCFYLIACEPKCVEENVSFYENGNVESKICYYGEKEDSTFLVTEFWETGELKSQFEFMKGKKNGIAIGYFKNGNVAAKKMFALGVEEDFDSTFYENGIVRSGFLINQGKRYEGNFFFDNGQPTGSLTFDENGYIASGIYYYPDGTLRSEGKFKNRRKTGIWKQYSEDGTLKSECNHFEGTKPKACTEY